MPALRDALVRAGERRRRRRRTVGAAVPTFAIAAAAVVFVLAQPSSPERDLTPASTPLARTFSVFARPQTYLDRTLPETMASAMTEGNLDPALTRRVSGAYVLATTTGSVCITQRDGDQITGSCAPAELVVAGARVAARTAESLTLLVPDGVRDIRLDYRDTAQMVSAMAQDNVIAAVNPDKLAYLSWTDADDVRRIQQYGKRQRWAGGRRCVGVFPFDALPADAAALARRQALLDAVQIEPTAASARVLSVEVAPRTQCSRDVSQRLVKVKMEFDARPQTVLVGWTKGNAQTFKPPAR
ncbi:hypothetical protein OJ997_14360 [Solirubrobacter phytolaccae]|uniref:Uncharacterized protein n=1 Tax=Solirubrobacter phytolaccae TaxID=1404360 RepID=A0A9X3N8K5_9ACTN|nr:hypothetical protein [Solirubrobacter phytolaccae]MDA0181484.1 hypothetical protein [Solirubrobacter phytolaccae]